MSSFPFEQPPAPRNPLRDIELRIGEMQGTLDNAVDTLVGVHEMSMKSRHMLLALRAVAMALIDTHPKPTELHVALLAHMDILADSTEVDDVESVKKDGHELGQYLQRIVARSAQN